MRGVALLSELEWPRPAGRAPGPWLVEGENAPTGAVRGFQLAELPWWLDDELWEIELAGRLRHESRWILAERGRLLRRVEEWTPEAASELVLACVERVQDDEAARLAGFAEDVGHYAAEAGGGARGAGVAAYIAAHALAGGDKTMQGYEPRFERERRWQVEWLRARLRL